MKKITLFLTLLLMFAVNATQAKSTQADSTQLNAVQVYSDIKAGLEGLALGLKTTADHVYPILIKQQKVQAYSALCVPIAFILVLITLLVIASCDSIDNRDLSNGMQTLLIIVLIILLIVSLCIIPSIITGFVNPEYGAIQDIVNFVK